LCHQGRNEGAREAQFPGRRITLGALHNYGGRGMTVRTPKGHNNVTSTFFNTVLLRLLPKDLRFEHGDDKLASCPGRRLTWVWWCNYSAILLSAEPAIKKILLGGYPKW